MDGDNNGNNGANNQVNAVTLKLPVFWPQDPELWFTQVEAQFTTRGINADATKYAYLVAALSPEVAAEVREKLMTPPADNKYESLKESIITRMTKSTQARIKQLLTAEELDGRKPSQLLRRMRQLIGANTGLVSDDLLKQIFYPRLPTHVQVMLAANDTLTLDKSAELADKLMDVIGPQVSAINTTTAASSSSSTGQTDPIDDVSALRREINELRTLIRGRQADKGNGTNGRSRSKTPHRNDDQDTATPGPCWFHSKFGDKAKKCRPGCTFKSGNGSGSH